MVDRRPSSVAFTHDGALGLRGDLSDDVIPTLHVRVLHEALLKPVRGLPDGLEAHDAAALRDGDVERLAVLRRAQAVGLAALLCEVGVRADQELILRRFFPEVPGLAGRAFGELLPGDFDPLLQTGIHRLEDALVFLVFVTVGTDEVGLRPALAESPGVVDVAVPVAILEDDRPTGLFLL